MIKLTKRSTEVEASKAMARDLFKHRDGLKRDPRRKDDGKGVYDNDSPASQWLEDMAKNSEALLRIYIDHLATRDWLFKQLTEQEPHCLLDVEGQGQMLQELRAWSEV